MTFQNLTKSADWPRQLGTASAMPGGSVELTCARGRTTVTVRVAMQAAGEFLRTVGGLLFRRALMLWKFGCWFPMPEIPWGAWHLGPR